jgi:lysozyme
MAVLFTIFTFIVQFEPYSHHAYFDRAQYTHGYGTKSKKHAVVSKSQAKKECIRAIEHHYKVVAEIPSLNSNQKMALTSFSYNVGENAFRRSKLYELASKGQLCEARQEFGKWVYQSGRKLGGLVKRRKAEKTLFSFGLDCKELDV